ncbi:MAG: hypothetical protein KC425_09150 [Anaerolineales bacterium]|nr:hypothetical protein [Anaerolineales bacterium]
MTTLTPVQAAAVSAAQTSFILGPTGSGKTTALQHRLLRLLQEGEPAYTILVLVAEPEHEPLFTTFLHASGLGPYADLKITSYSRLAQEMVTLFWPLIARPAGFARPYQPPTTLTYDLAQLLMWHVITPMLAEGAFANLRLRPQQIVSQLLDTLNRAALNGLSLDEAIERQQTTWLGEPERQLHLADAAKAARAFRHACLANSLLDLSLVVEVFDTQLVHHPEFHRYFSERYRHLLVDNVEEQTPAGQNFVAGLMDATQTTAIAYDAGGGYKRFMAADPLGANKFYARCQHVFELETIFTAPPEVIRLAHTVENYLMHTTHPTAGADAGVLDVVNGRYRRDMVNQLAVHLADRVAAGVHPRDIAIVVPYLDGALRYMLARALQQAGLPYFLLRRRSSPRDEPHVRAWLTWLALAHPAWQRRPSRFDVAEALTLSIAGLDPARAHLLAEHLVPPDTGQLQTLDDLPPDVAGRVGADFVALAAELSAWLQANGGQLPLDAFLYRLFNELLAQPRFHPEPDLAGAAVCDWLVQAATRLRQAAEPLGFRTPAAIGTAFIDGIYNGLVTANPPELGDPPDPDGIMVATIYAYLLAGRPVRLQVWLETAATGWWDIPNQPLSNAFVLAQSRSPERPWTTEEEFAIRNQLLSRIVRGLAARCREGVLLANSDLDRRGVRQDGILWRAVQPLLRQERPSANPPTA